MRFQDRQDAGRRLAEELAAGCEGQDGIVYALPHGGAVVGAEVAHRLELPLDLVVTRKIGHPYNADYPIGAVTETGEPVINRLEAARVQVEWISRCVSAERLRARRERERYVGGRAPLAAAGKLAILVDEGVASGFSMRAAIRALRQQGPARLIVAVPIVVAHVAAELEREADDVIALARPENDGLPARIETAYERFPPVTEEDMVKALRAANPPGRPRGPV